MNVPTRPILFGLFTALLLTCANTVTGTDILELSEEESAWVAANPELHIANELDWPPFDFAENGEPKGYAIDMVQMIARKAGLRVKFVSGLTWVELMDGFKADEIDVMPAIYQSEKRDEFALFTSSYF